jgi:oligopeptide transport system substrate-binding protein
VHTHVVLATSYLALNTRDVAAFKDIRVRRALSMGVDREFIAAKLMRAGQQPAYSFVPPGTANYERGAQLRWRHLSFAQRQAEARRLLARAGYGPNHPLKIEIKSPSVTDTLLVMQAVQADWREIGVDASVVQAEAQIAFADYRNRNFQVGGMSWYADYNDPLTFLGLLRSQTGAQNYADYSNPRYDALIAASDEEPDVRRRADLLRQAEQVMLDDEAIIPVYFVVSRNLVNPRVTGWVDNLSDIHRAMFLCVKPSADAL